MRLSSSRLPFAATLALVCAVAAILLSLPSTVAPSAAEDGTGAGSHAAGDGSATALPGLSSDEARAAARRHFGGVLEAPAFAPLRGRRAERWYGMHTVRVSDPDGDRLVTATLPLRTARGDAAPHTDLSLVQANDGFRPASPIVSLHIGAQVADGFTIGDRESLHMAPVGVAAGDRGRIEGANVFFANARPDTDIVVRPVGGGAETFEVIRSPQSPELLAWRVSGRGTTTLRPGGGGDGGGAAVEVVRAGEVVGTLTEPRAWDADGEPVDVVTDVDGELVRMSVRHRDRDVSYPILVDPVIEQYKWECVPLGNSVCDTNYTGWQSQATAPASRYAFSQGTGVYGPGLYVRSVSATDLFSGGDRAEWFYRGPGTSSIVRAYFQMLDYEAGSGGSVCFYTGIRTAQSLTAAWNSGPLDRCQRRYENDVASHSTAGNAGNVAAVGVVVPSGTPHTVGSFQSHAGWVELELRDEDRPIMDVGYDGRWTRGPIPVQVSDHGTGLTSASLSHATPFTSTCTATRHGQLCPPSAALSADPPEGVTELTGSATDALGQRTQAGRGVRATYWDTADASGPTVNHVEEQVNLQTSGRPTQSIAESYYAARWLGRLKAPATGSYTFTVNVDDRVQLSLGGQQILNATCCGERTSTAVTLTAGQMYDLKVELQQDAGGAATQLYWTLPGATTKQLVPAANLYLPSRGLVGDVYDAPQLSGARYRWPFPSLDLDWGSGPADMRMDPDDFSVEWKGQIEPRYSEDYTFSVVADDYATVFIDGREVVNDAAAGGTEVTGTPVRLRAGSRHDIRVTYSDSTGSAFMKLYWRSASQPKEVVPESRLWMPFDGGPLVAKVDKSAPTGLSRSGPLVTLANSGRAVAAPTVLNVSAQDGTSAAPRSGVASAQLEIDGQPASEAGAGTQRLEQACPAGSCGLTGAPLTFDPAGLSHGFHDVTVAVTDHVGLLARTEVVKAAVDRRGPRITSSGPVRDAAGRWLPAGATDVAARVEDGTSTEPGHGVKRVRLLVDGQERDAESPVCAASCTVDVTLSLGAPLAAGEHTIAVVAEDMAGNATTDQWTVKVDRTAPGLTVSGALAALDGKWVAGGQHGLSIAATDAGSGVVRVAVRLDGIEVFSAQQACVSGGCGLSRAWTLDASALAVGTHYVHVDAADAAGQLTTKTITIKVDTAAPAIALAGILADADGGIISSDAPLRVDATDGDAGVRSVEILLDGQRKDFAEQACAAGACRLSRDWTLSTAGLAEGAHTVRVVAIDFSGRQTTDDVQFDFDTNGPPVAPPLAEHEITPFADQTEFLYSGPDRVQTGVAAGTIEPRRAGVIRGKVTKRDGTPIGDAAVTVIGHPEFGRTTTRSDGELFMAVNGGGPLTVRLQKHGYLPVDRQVDVPWQGYAHIEPTVMIQPDPAVTTVTQGVMSPLQVHRASVETDVNGSRRATLLFPQGITAQMEMSDGSTRDLPSTFSVRATEYTVGATGPAAMPAPLPPTSAYTYAADFSIDEARQAGARHVHFNKPVIGYLENFRGAPVGSRVPNGYYERSTGQWVPDTDGTVVKVISEQNGVATLEIYDSTPHNDHTPDDTDTAATAQELARLGITSDELQKVAQLYEPGQELWRVPTRHFSDWNYSFLVFGSIMNPPDWFKDRLKDLFCGESGSVIECENQTLGEDVAITGAGVGLHYRSDRTSARKADNYTIDVPLVGETVPTGLRGVDVIVEVAGRRFAWEGGNRLPATANRRFRFEWDGLDAFGRRVNGAVNARLQVGYAYNIVYSADDDGNQTAPDGGAGAFGAPPEGSNWTFFTDTVTCTGRPPQCEGGGIGGEAGPPTVSVWNETDFALGGWDARDAGLGGWTLSPHHQYDPIAKTVYRGDGTRQHGESVSRTITRVAGGGSLAGDPPPGGEDPDAEDVRFEPGRTATGPDGSVFVVERSNNVVRRIAPNGTIARYAGVFGRTGYNDDDDPDTPLLARDAWLSGAYDLDVGPDGSVYIADAGNRRVRRVTPDGKITTVAGGGTSAGPAPATDLSIFEPRGVAVAPDGTLYIGDRAGKIWRVAPGGMAREFSRITSAGIYDLSLAADGRLFAVAIHTSFVPGVLYEIEASGHARQLTEHFSELSSGPVETRDTAPLSEARVSVRDVAVTADGTVHITDSRNNRVWRLTWDADAPGGGELVRIAGDTRPPAGTYDNGDGGAARQATLASVSGLAFSPDGGMLVSDDTTLRRVGDAMPGFDNDEIRIPSDDGTELYAFDATGRHLGTYDTMTGRRILTFGYADEGTGPLTSITDDDGNTVTVERDDSGTATAILAGHLQRARQHRTGLSVGANGWLSSITDPAAGVTSMTYKGEGLLETFERPGGRVSAFGWDAEGRLLRDDDAEAGFKTLLRSQDDEGFEVTVATAEGRTRQIRTERPDAETTERIATDAAGQSTTTISTDSGSVMESPDGTRVTTELSPDPRFKSVDGQVAPYVSRTEVQRPSQRANNEKSLMTVSRAANLEDPDDPLSIDTLSLASAIGGRLSRTTYDADLRTIVSESPSGRTTTSHVDEKGRAVLVDAPDVLDLTYGYDAEGRPTTVTQGDRTSTTSYDPATGWVASVTDPLDRTTTYERDALGRVTAAHLPGGRTVGYDYDAAGNLRQIAPPGRPAHTFTHSLTGLRTNWTPPATTPAGSTTYAYDDDGQLERITRPDGRTVDFMPDTAGRINRVTHSGVTATLAYDETSGTLDGLTSTDGYGLEWEYDGTLAVRETATGAVAGTVRQTFDVDGRLVSSTVEGTPAVPYEFDLDDLVTKAGALTLSRDADSGQLTGTTIGLATTGVTYDPYGDVQTQTYRHDGQTRFSEALERDDGGRVSGETETLAGSADRRFDYVYDASGRLDQVKRDGAVVADYGYDANGNRTSEKAGSTTITSTFDDQDRLLRRGDVEYRYTANGDLRTKIDGSSATTYTYDTIGNLRSVGLPGGSEIRYLVDPLGRRVGREVGGQRTAGWLYGETNRPSAELNADGTIRSRFVYATTTNVPAYMVRDGKTYRFVTDRLGSPRLVVDVATGQVEQELDYDVWGKVVKDTKPGFQPFGFAGGLYDGATRLVRFGARDYDPETGRWTTQDPIDFSGGDPNLYGYAANDPVNFVDPSGLYIDAIPDAAATGWALGKYLSGCGSLGDVLTNAAGLAVPGVSSAMLRGFKNLADASRAFDNADEPVELWRAVGPDEVADIQRHGGYRARNPGEPKYMYPTREQAENYVQQSPVAWGPYTITKTTVPKSKLADAELIEPIGEGHAYVFQDGSIPSTPVTIYNYSRLP